MEEISHNTLLVVLLVQAIGAIIWASAINQQVKSLKESMKAVFRRLNDMDAHGTRQLDAVVGRLERDEKQLNGLEQRIERKP